MNRPKSPYKVLFSNDTTNIETCTSPFHKKGEKFQPEMLEATVDETAGIGVEAHLLQPGVGWVPWWKSTAYPFEEHILFMKERFDMEPSVSGFAAYMAAGGDMVQVFVERCRQKGISPFVSLRLNDGHGHEFVNMPKDKIPEWAWHVLTPIHVNHPEWRIGDNLGDWNQRVLNWAIPEARNLKFRFIEEIAEQYDIDGFELDFMRHSSFFRQNETTSKERTAIMTGFVRDVRDLLNRTAKPDQHRWLCVRVPCYMEPHDALGIDLRAMVDADVEMVNLSPSYFTVQQNDAAKIKRMLPDAKVYLEMCHCTRTGKAVGVGYDNFTFRRTTYHQYLTAAHLAYARGLDGVSAFNFVYYREHGVGERGPFDEPPFHVFQHMSDPNWLAKQPQHYILASVWGMAYMSAGRLPRALKVGQTAAFDFDMAPPEGGWEQGGRFRIQAEESLGNNKFTAALNGGALAETDDRSEPYDSLYSPLLGTGDMHRAWLVPQEILKDGVNTVEVSMVAGDTAATLVFLDFALQ